MDDHDRHGERGPLRCDWCGVPIEMDEGDTLALQRIEGGTERDPETGEPVGDVSACAMADGVARAVENIGGPKDADLAASIREHHGFTLHKRCFERSALTDVYTEIEP